MKSRAFVSSSPRFFDVGLKSIRRWVRFPLCVPCSAGEIVDATFISSQGQVLAHFESRVFVCPEREKFVRAGYSFLDSDGLG